MNNRSHLEKLLFHYSEKENRILPIVLMWKLVMKVWHLQVMVVLLYSEIRYMLETMMKLN